MRGSFTAISSQGQWDRNVDEKETCMLTLLSSESTVIEITLHTHCQRFLEDVSENLSQVIGPGSSSCIPLIPPIISKFQLQIRVMLSYDFI